MLNRIISGMSKEEIRFFKVYASRIATEGKRKDIELFDMIRKEGGHYNERAAAAEMYPDGNMNPYYRLKNRLKRDICKSLMLHHFEHEGVTHTVHLYNLARHYMRKNLFELSEHFLRKAEKRALQAENHEVLDLIYSEFIRLSQEMVTIDPETYILKRQRNGERLAELRKVDDILATVKYKLKITQNFSPVDNPVIDMLTSTVEEFAGSNVWQSSTALRLKIYQAASQILLQQHDYQNLEDHIRTMYAEFEGEKLFHRGNHEAKLQMLTYMINALFKNGKTDESLLWAEKLKDAMEEFDRLHYNKFLFFYYNSLVINFSKIDKDKAISILEQLEHDDQIKSAQFYIVFVYLNLSIFHFDLGHYRTSIKRLNQLYNHDRYGQTSVPLKFRIAVLEIIIRVELQDADFLDYRMKQIRKEFSDQLKNEENVRDSILLDLITDIYLNGISVRNRDLMERIKLFVRSASARTDDAELVNYNGWLERKLAP